MNDHLDETSHIISLKKIENDKKYKERIWQEIIVSVCAMLNSNGGKMTIQFETDRNDILVDGPPSSKISLVKRMLEQAITSIIGLRQTLSKINFKQEKQNILVIFVKKADSLITNSYKLYLPSETQVVEVSSELAKDIINRKTIPNPVELGSHCKAFVKDKNCGLYESKVCQLKNLKAEQSKRTTLADRITGKGNKLSCYVSAFANDCGGHIHYGINDDGFVEGEIVPNEQGKKQILKKVEKTLNKMIWPEHIGQPKRGEQWEIFFEPVKDENSKPVPSTYVIVIYIAPCLGGVFTEEPEYYKMVKGGVTKMLFATWKKRLSRPVWLCDKEKNVSPVPRVTGSSAAARETRTVGITYHTWPIKVADQTIQ